MQKNVTFGLPNLITLNFFTFFPEYFISISLIYILIIILITNNHVYNFLVQNVLSNCVSIVLLMTTYLIYNDDILVVNFLTFNNSCVNDYFSFFIKIIICLFSTFYFFIVANFLKKQKLIHFEYLLLLLFAVLGLLIVCNSYDLLISYLAIELVSFSLYILAAFKKTCTYSINSGIKYFITGAIASAFYLLGSSIIYGFTGSINFLDFYNLFHCFNNYIPELKFSVLLNLNQHELLKLTNIFKIVSLYQQPMPNFLSFTFLEWGFSLIIFSLFIKLALAPFHFWSLDVYEGAPTSSTFFFAVISKISIFVLLFRLCYNSFFNFKNWWQFYSAWIGLFSILVGSFGGLTQRKIKTLFAYSSINHIGYSLIAFSTATFSGIQLFIFYFLVYMITGFVIWYIFLLIQLKSYSLINNKYSKELSHFILLKKSNSGLAFSFALIMFSVAGIPPVIGFLSKIIIFLPVIGISFYYLALWSIVFSVISTFYYIRIIKILYFENLLVGKLYYPIQTTKIIFLSFLVFLVIYFFINPNFLYLVCCKSIIYFL